MSLVGTAAKAQGSTVAVSFREGWLRHLRVGMGSAGWVALLLGLFALLQRQPAEGFGLLTSWGPWPFVALLGLGFLGHFMSRLNDTIQASFSAVVSSVQQGADAHGRTADALSRLADQGDRHAVELERLTIYAAQEFPGIYERLDQQDSVLGKLETAVGGIYTLLQAKEENHGHRS